MAEIKDLLAYLLKHYPNKDDLSNARITKLIYLCDWKYSIDYGKQITSIEWHFDNFGPFVWDVIDTAKSYPKLFSLEYSTNFFGGSKTIVNLRDSYYQPTLSDTESKTADYVIKVAEKKTWDGFIKLVYSTYPIVNSEKYKTLDLPKLAHEYKHSKVYKTSVTS